MYPGEQTAGVNGAGMAQVNYQLDGAGHNDTYLNASVPFPNPDAVQEFNLQSSNFTAEYGNAAGGIVNIVTSSGTNELHGSALRIPAERRPERAQLLRADARHAEAQPVRRRRSAGPSQRTSCFIFGTYQGTRIRSEPAGSVAFVPTAAERAGDFSSFAGQLVDPVTRQPFPNNQIPASRISPVAKYFLKWIPLPNRARPRAELPRHRTVRRRKTSS